MVKLAPSQAEDLPADAAALIFDENGVWLRTPQWAQGKDAAEVPRYVLAACELAARLAAPGEIELMAAAFEARCEREGDL